MLGINASVVYEGNLKLILGMVYSVFRSPMITKIGAGGKYRYK